MKQTGKNGSLDVTKPFGAFGAPGVDFDVVLSSRRKNLDTLTQVNHLAVEGMQTIDRHQLKTVQQAIELELALFRDWPIPLLSRPGWQRMSTLRSGRSRRASSAPET
jgi:hypothetical protein